jgi:hypothetical protein
VTDRAIETLLAGLEAPVELLEPALNLRVQFVEATLERLRVAHQVSLASFAEHEALRFLQTSQLQRERCDQRKRNECETSGDQRRDARGRRQLV